MSNARVADIALSKVSKTFANRQVLKSVSFDVAPGEALCVMGRSGIGKSVTLKLMIGLLKPDAGNILIQGRNVVGMSEDDLSRTRRQMGFLFQGGALFSQLTVNDNLVLPLERFTKKSRQEIDSMVQTRLEQVGLGNDRYKMPSELSGGMQRRAGLARALILDPHILLADEPTSGLDRITAREIDDLLLQVREKSKTTMVIVTHDSAGARRIGDRVAVLDNGEIVALGTIPELEKDENELVRALVSEEGCYAH
jgi:phospholipid/cholesterol/gamma-HCH transport system ATP-binding protein